jgi:phage gpG-like protein
MIPVTITSNIDAQVAKTGERAVAVLMNLRSTMQELAIRLQGKVKSEKLSGQVLNVRTGNLRNSISQRLVQDGSMLYAIVGTNVPYAARHEFGFQGTETVRSFMRRTKGEMKLATYFYKNSSGERVSKVRQTGKFGKSSGTGLVRSFTRQANTPERSFLRSALLDMSD